jgi:YHS domain-containing protein
MNRCITCGKLVTRPKAQNKVQYDGHEYLVCCPLCEKEFNSRPSHYVAVLQAALGDYTLKAHTPAPYIATRRTRLGADVSAAGEIHLIQSLERKIDEIGLRYQELEKHFEHLAESGGLNGLRSAMNEHRVKMDEFRNQMMILVGVCKFVTAVVESSDRAYA